MPTMSQSAAPNMDGWEPAPDRGPAAFMPVTDLTTPNRSPNMLASMPLMASTGDAFQLQFYGGANIPTFRVLPIRRGGGA